MSESLQAQVMAALSRIRNPRLENDLLSAGMVRDLEVGPDGRVAFTFLLSRQDPATLVREARAALREIDGVGDIKINVVDPAGSAPAAHQPPPPPTPVTQPALGKIIAISSGKGGVGKSTVTANLAVALATQGHAVGVMDADVYGPNIPRMFGLFEKPLVEGGKIQPLQAFGVKLMSLGFLVERDAPAIWRGPIIMKIVQQFLRDVDWGRLDYLLVDLPPGTGDAQLSLVQATHVAGAVIVTTPQEMAVGDALRGAKMFERVNVPVLGIVENMSAYSDPATGARLALFSEGGGRRLAEELGVPLLGSVPLQPGLAEAADRGQPVLVNEPASAAAGALRGIADALVGVAATGTVELPILRG
ncbi:MAG TPA: Mrp/NBP35 family ATP-binding protein [Gemmatimonadales bacterium]|nr:Mrp/NBP35 family ATP-binding protein [Gemmatimonadales bacterium]